MHPDIDLTEASKVLSTPQLERLKALLSEYRDVFAIKYGQPTPTDGTEMTIDIPDSQAPIWQPVRRWNPKLKLVLVKFTKELLEAGVIEPSESPWNSNLFCVPKKSGAPRLVQDLTSINRVTRPVPSTLPRIDECLQGMGGAQYFSVCDLDASYYQIPLALGSRAYTAFTSPLGRFQWTRAVMGLKNSQSYLINATSRMLLNSGLVWDRVAVYSDDICVYSPTVEEHLSDLEKLFSGLRSVNLSLSAKKCLFFSTKVEYCGYFVDRHGIHIDPKSVEAINRMPPPKSIKELKSFLGCTSWWRKYIPHYARICAPLRPLLKAGRFSPLSPEQLSAIDQLKSCLVRAPVLRHPDFEKPFRLCTDGSPTGIGAVLLQLGEDGKEHAVSYFSRSLTEAQQGYPQFEIEALAVLTGLEVFRSFFMGETVHIFTDAESLRYLLAPEGKLKGRKLRWFLRISEFDYVIHHRKAADHPVPDCLSRLHGRGSLGVNSSLQVDPYNADDVSSPASLSECPEPVCDPRGPLPPPTHSLRVVLPASVPVDLSSTNASDAFRRHQRADPWCMTAMSALRSDCLCRQKASALHSDQRPQTVLLPSGTHLRSCLKSQYVFADGLLYSRATADWVFHVDGDGRLIRSLPTGRKHPNRVVVPRALVSSVCFYYHGLPITGHVGATRTRNAILQRFTWKGLTRDVSRWVSACIPCARRKRRCNPHADVPGTLSSSKPFDVLAIDFVGPLNETEDGNRWILTAIDVFTRYPFAVALPNRRAESVARALFEHVFQYFSLCRVIVSDNGAEFVGKVMEAFNRLFNITHIRTLPYSPMLNSCLENFHRFLNASLTILGNRFKDDWDARLPVTLSAYRVSVHATTGYSPFQAVFGRDPRLGIDLSLPDVAPDLGRQPQTIGGYVERTASALQRTHTEIRDRQSRVQEASRLRRMGQYREVLFKVGDLVMASSPTAEPLPNRVTPTRKLLDRNIGPLEIVRVVSKGSSRKYVVRDPTSGKEFRPFRPSRLALYTPWTPDGTPSVPPRQGFTATERRQLNKESDGDARPRPVQPGDLVLFPRQMNDGSHGYGVGRAVAPDLSGGWDLQWYGNAAERLDGVYRPCWFLPSGLWYSAGRPTHPGHAMVMTSDTNSGPLTEDMFAAVGFSLTMGNRLPAAVRRSMESHPAFKWSSSSQ